MIFEDYRISLEESSVGRELKAMGFAKLSAHPRHYAQNELAVEDFKKFPGRDPRDQQDLHSGHRNRAVIARKARIGQKNKMTRQWAQRGTRPSAPTISERYGPTYSGDLPEEGKGCRHCHALVRHYFIGRGDTIREHLSSLRTATHGKVDSMRSLSVPFFNPATF
ncbi:winged helix-turn-helix domain-containing protein [Rhizobium sp. SEMIA 4085]|nr:winged helix-turn-helix domain-containing protein [Rhizobium sp. SEMIA 4085]